MPKGTALTRSSDKMIAGVCAGIADYLGWEPLHVRLAFVLIGLIGGAAILAYIVLWIFMPAPKGAGFDDF